jgi:hypothetical protein
MEGGRHRLAFESIMESIEIRWGERTLSHDSYVTDCRVGVSERGLHTVEVSQSQNT